MYNTIHGTLFVGEINVCLMFLYHRNLSTVKNPVYVCLQLNIIENTNHRIGRQWPVQRRIAGKTNNVPDGL